MHLRCKWQKGSISKYVPFTKYSSQLTTQHVLDVMDRRQSCTCHNNAAVVATAVCGGTSALHPVRTNDLNYQLIPLASRITSNKVVVNQSVCPNMTVGSHPQ
jgi:hypothetical protein